jgi:hypothetical protein
MIIFLLLLYPSLYFSVLRWGIFLGNYGLQIKKTKLFFLYYIGTFFNNFFPTTLGGDVYKFANLNKKFVGAKKEIAASIILDRGSGLIALFLVNIFLAPFFYNLIVADPRFLFLEITIFLGLLAILFLIRNKRWLLRIEKWSKREIVTPLVTFQNKKLLLYGLVYSVFSILLSSIILWGYFLAFDTPINFFYVLLVSTVTLIMGILPISFNSIGITEGLNVFLFGLVGVPLEISLAVTLAGRVSSLAINSLGGLLYFINGKIKY